MYGVAVATCFCATRTQTPRAHRRQGCKRRLDARIAILDDRRLLARIGLNDTNDNEPVSPRSQYGMHHSQPALAVAQEGAFVPSPGRHPHRPPGIQVHLPDHDHADRERGPLVTDVAATALVCM